MSPVDRLPARIGGLQVARMDLFGHSLAAEGGAAQLDFGMWHKIASHLSPAILNSLSQGGSKIAMPEGDKVFTTDAIGVYCGTGRAFQEFTETWRGTVGPYLPVSQLIAIWQGANDLSWLGPANLVPFQEALRVLIARTRVASVFESNATTVSNGVTPIVYTGSWTRTTGAYAYASGGEYSATTTAYPTSKATLQIPSDYGAGVLQVGFLSLGSAAMTGNPGALWDVVNVTAGGSTVLGTAIETRNQGGSNYNMTTATGTAMPAVVGRRHLPMVRRFNLGAPPTTTLTAVLKPQDTTATVTSTANFDSAGTLDIANERMTYTSKTATTFAGLTRSVAGSFIWSHPVGRTLTGSRTIEVRPTTVTTSAALDYWALEATTTPLTYVMLHNRFSNYGVWSDLPYNRVQSTVASGGASGTNTVQLSTTTVTGAHTNAVTSFTVGSTAFMYGFMTSLMIGTGPEVVTATSIPSGTTFSVTRRGSHNTAAASYVGGETVKPWVRVGDTITIGSETRTVTAYSAGGQVTVNTNWGTTHTAGEEVVSGIQDYDLRSILNPATSSVVAEFSSDLTTFAVDPEAALFPVPDGPVDYSVWANDGVHFNDEGHARLAANFLEILNGRLASIRVLAKASVDDRMAYTDSFYGQVTFQNGWTSYNTTHPAWNSAANNLPAPFGWRKDFITRRVRLRGAVKNATPANWGLVICTLPLGFRPATDEDWYIGAYRLQIKQNGDVLFPDAPYTAAYVPINVMFEAGG